MINDDQLEKEIRDLLIDICEIMYERGYETVPVGAMMRLVGVDNENSAKYDDEYFPLDQEFQETLKTRKNPPPKSAPQGVTLH